MKYAHFLLFALMLAVPCQAARPNVLIILADDLGYGDVSAYGAPDIQTPHIDNLIAEGIRFNQFYANSTVCSPTRAALLSGRYPDLAGVPGVIRTHPDDSWGFLTPGIPLLSNTLKEAGYTTAIIGKWHLGLESPNLPNERGFDFFHGFLGDMMDDYFNHRRHGINYMRLNSQVIDPPGHATDLFTDWAIDFIHQERTKPFFLYLAYNAPHTPIQPPTEWVHRVLKRHPNIDPKRAQLAGLIEHMDSGIGRVMKALNDSGAAESTLVIFTSDNGGQISAAASNSPLRGGKQDMYEGGLRVPTAIVWPEKIAANQSRETVALTMDLFPTICEIAGAPLPDQLDGLSLAPVLFDAQFQLPDRDLFWMRREGNLRYNGKEYHAMRRGPWKLVQNHPFEPFQLFNLEDDPLEERDVRDSQSQVYQSLSKQLRLHLQRAGAVPWQPASAQQLAR